MQFISHGPDVPDSLLEAHEEGRVVFFCGAGVSFPANLPSFRRLVSDIRDEMGTSFNPAEAKLFEDDLYDRTLESMERRLTSGRLGVRRALTRVLTSDLSPPEATRTHAALLQLAKTSKGVRRLVTTNFDRIFEYVIQRDGISLDSYPAPLLPIPKPSRWDGIVYLHGLLPEKPSDASLNRLVVTSGDFGRAYLTERWAARFVSELFRNFVVCFVGYSINDPILRYMMDALAADRLQGETTQRAYAFGDFHAGDFEAKKEDWLAKGVEPILYETKPGDGHAALHGTLIEWSNMHRDGALGRDALVTRNAVFPPQKSTKEDDYVGRVIWALCDPSSMPARKFANLKPVPPLEWLQALEERRFSADHASRFDFSSKGVEKESLPFSLISRPSPTKVSPTMSLTHRHETMVIGGFDGVMFELARWLLHHLGNPDLIIWIAEHGGRLHPVLKRLIDQHLRSLASQKKNHPEAYEAAISESPLQVPGELLQPFWDLLLEDMAQARGHEDNFYVWLQAFKAHGLNWSTRRRLLEYLSPRVELRRPYGFSSEREGVRRRADVVGWDLVIRGEYVAHSLKEMDQDPKWRAALPVMLNDFAGLLTEALDISASLRDDDGYELASNYFRPSIEEHTQNLDHREWTVLVDLTRDAWLETFKANPGRAGGVAQGWWGSPHSLFKRLALFAARHPTAIDPEVAFEWVRIDARWLWSEEARTEVMPWLRLAGTKLGADDSALLQRLITSGPPAILTDGHPNPEALARHFQTIELIALLNLVEGGAQLIAEVQTRLTQLRTDHPDVHLSENYRENFSAWMSSGFGTASELRQLSELPRELPQLVESLRASVPNDFWHSDDWRELCLEDFELASRALLALAGEGAWSAGRWQTALYAWATPAASAQSWAALSATVLKMPETEIVECRHAVADWLNTLGMPLASQEEVFFDVCQRLIQVCPEDEPKEGARPVDTAINHPIGKVTGSILRWWYATTPVDDVPLPEPVASILSAVADEADPKLRHGRVLIASNLISIFRADPSWVKIHFLRYFDWQADSVEAAAAWDGFLWNARGHRGLLEALKPQLLETAKRYDSLCNHAKQYVGLFVYAALEMAGLLTPEEVATTLASLPHAGLDHAAVVLSYNVSNASDSAAYWTNRVQPFVHTSWPKDNAKRTQEISSAFARLCIWAGDAIATALPELAPWLIPVDTPGSVYLEVARENSAMCRPKDVLWILDAITPDDARWTLMELPQCLEKIRAADGSLAEDAAFKRLQELARRIT